MLRAYLLLAILSVMSVASAEVNYVEELKKDAVVVVGNKMTFEVSGLVTALDGVKRQVLITCEAPIASISRDNFVMFSTIFYLASVSEMGEFNVLDEKIGDPDATIKIVMSGGGVQVTATDNTSNTVLSKTTSKWSDILSGE